MATINAVNLKNSGIASYDGAGNFSALANPLTVSNGGQGNSSLTTYAVLCGGTTSTGVVQSIASVGTAGQVLTSNGAGALPTFQNNTRVISAYYTFTTTATFNPADGTTRYVPWAGSIVTTNNVIGSKYYIPAATTITKAYGLVRIAGTLGSAENVTVAIRVNNTTDTNITTTSQWTANPTTFSNTGLSLALSAGDFIEIKLVYPTWATNPTTCLVTVQLYGT